MANRSNGSNLRRIWIRGISGLAIGAFFLWLTLRQVSWEQVSNILSQADLGWLLAAIGFYAINMVVRILRWRRLLWNVKILSFGSVAIALLVGYAVNNILPARLGELFRANFVRQNHRVPRSAVIGSIVVERVLDGLLAVIGLVIGGLFLAKKPALLNHLTGWGSLLFLGTSFILYFLSQRRTLHWLRGLPPAIVRRIQGFSQGLSAVEGFNGLVIVLGLSLVIFLLNLISHCLILKAIGVSLGLHQMLSIVGIVSLSTVLPSAPGFVGTYQYAYAFAVSLFDYEPAQGVAAATATQIFLLGSQTLTGVGIYVYLNLFKSGANGKWLK